MYFSSRFLWIFLFKFFKDVYFYVHVFYLHVYMYTTSVPHAYGGQKAIDLLKLEVG